MADVASRVLDTASCDSCDTDDEGALDESSVPMWAWIPPGDHPDEGSVALEWKALDEFGLEELRLQGSATLLKELEQMGETRGTSLESAMVAQAVSEQVQSLHSLQSESLETHAVSVLTAKETLDDGKPTASHMHALARVVGSQARAGGDRISAGNMVTSGPRAVSEGDAAMVAAGPGIWENKPWRGQDHGQDEAWRPSILF